MDQIIAYCGLVCSYCPAYTATQSGDRAELERVAAQWREQFNEPQITADSILCDGCLASNGRLSGYCSVCRIRACAVERGVVNCAHCADYACGQLQEWFTHAAEAQKVLEGIRAAL